MLVEGCLGSNRINIQARFSHLRLLRHSLLLSSTQVARSFDELKMIYDSSEMVQELRSDVPEVGQDGGLT